MAFFDSKDLALVDAIDWPLREGPRHTFSSPTCDFGMDLKSLSKFLHTSRTEVGDGVALQLFSFAVTAFRVADDEKDKGFVVLEFDTLVTNRDVPTEPLAIKFSRRTARELWDNPGTKQHVIRNCLRDIVLHEVDENIYVDGKREFDPHVITKVELTMRFGAEEGSAYKLSTGSRYLR